jgi:hypothetical protein
MKNQQTGESGCTSWGAGKNNTNAVRAVQPNSPISKLVGPQHHLLHACLPDDGAG